MALAYLLDPCQQYQNRAGVNNVSGYLEVFRMDTDDRATVYVDFNGTLAPEHIGIDNDGRAVMIVESGRPYRVEMHGPNGDLFWTQQPVWPLASGGGVSGTDIVSSDGSISVYKTTVGSITTYDLSANVEDSTELLGWIRCDGASNIDGTDIWKPTYTAGTLMVGERGIVLTGGQYFHATARVRVMKSAVSGYYDDMQLIFKLYDGETSTEVARQGIVVDGSMPLYQDFEISCDALPEDDCELVLEIVGKELDSLGVQVLDTEVHRVFSGAPYIPSGVASKSWTNDNYQGKLTAGQGITIDENNVISGSGGESYTAGTGINIDSSNAISVDFRTVQPKLVAGYGISISGSTISSTTYLPPHADTDDGKCLVVDNNDYSGLSWQTRLKGDNIVLPENTRSGDTVDGWSWTEFQARIDANVAAGTPTMLTSTGSSRHPEGETAFYYHAIRDGSIASGWIYEFGTVVANPHTYQTMTVPTPSKSVTYLFYQYGEDDVKVLIRYNQMVPCPNLGEEYGYYRGCSLIIKEDGTGFDWSPRQDPINDLSEIRAGAQLGATSVQPADLNSYATDSELAAGLATKQGVINDLDQIRSGASAGSTAVQPADLAPVATSGDYNDLTQKPDLSVYATTSAMTTALAGKQDVIDDLSAIRAGAQAGSTAVQPETLNDYVTNSALATTLADYVTDTELGTILESYATTTALSTGLAGKQDVINDLSAIRAGAQAGATAVQPAALDSYATKVELNTGLSGKQDTINDLSEIRSGAAAGSTALQPSDVAEVATTGDYDDLTNKPSIPTATSDLTNDSGFITSADVPVKDVQVDGASVVNAQGVAEITMPDLSGYATTQALNTGLAGKQDTISDLSTIRSGAAAGATAVQPADLATVATTGDYDDLSNKPTIPSGAQLVPAATSADADKVLTVDSLGVPGWAIVPAQSTGLFQATYGTSTYNEVRDAVADNKIVYCNFYGRMAFLAFVSSNSYEFQYYRSNNSSSGTDSVFVYQVNSSGWTTVERAVKAGNIRYPVTQVNVNGSSAMTGTVANITIPAAPTVDQTYDASSANAQSGVAVAQAIGSVDAVPDVTSSDSGKVLVANYSGGAGSYAWSSTPPANAIILDSSSTWADFHTPYSAGRKDIYYKHTSPYAPLDSRAELYLHLTAVSDVDGSSTNFTYALFEGAWRSGGVEYSIRCKIRYSGVPLVFSTPLTADQSYSASSTNAQSGVAVAQAISAVNQVPSSTSADADKVLTVNAQGAPAWASAQAPISAGNGIDITNNVVSVDTSVVATQTDLASKQDTISDLATIRSGAAEGATAVQPGDLATVATTGSYDDLVDKPTIPAAQVNSDWNSNSGVSQILNKPTLAAVATTGDYDDLSNKPSIPAAQVNSDWNATSGVSEILNKPSIPTATSDLTNDSGFITLSDVPAQVQADWNSSSGASEILNKPTIPSGTQLVPTATSADADKVLTVDAQGTPAWASAQAPISAGDGVEITNNVVSAKVDGTTVTFNASGELQAAAAVTVDQTYNAASTNAQSGTAVAQAVATKEDAFDVGTGLEMDTSGSTPTLQVEAPVDIVAGPGIVIDNPDGNTLRVSVAQAEEVVLCNTVSNSSCTLSEAYSNFERIRISFTQEDPSTIAENYAFTPMTAEFYCADIENNAGHKVTLTWGGLDGVTGAGSNNLLFRIGVWQFTTSTTFAKLLGKQFYVSWACTDTSKLYVTKVVGIHRIAGGN